MAVYHLKIFILIHFLMPALYISVAMRVGNMPRIDNARRYLQLRANKGLWYDIVISASLSKKGAKFYTFLSTTVQ